MTPALWTTWPRDQVFSGARKYLRSSSNKDAKRQRERYKTIDLITEYNSFKWEYSHLATFAKEKLKEQFWSFIENVSSRI